MVEFTFYAELAIAIIRLIIILIGMLICIELITKTTGKLRLATIFFLIAFIPSILYTIMRILNIEALFAAGEFLSLSLNLLTTLGILAGLLLMNKLINELSCPKSKNKKRRKKQKKSIFSFAKPNITRSVNKKVRKVKREKMQPIPAEKSINVNKEKMQLTPLGRYLDWTGKI